MAVGGLLATRESAEDREAQRSEHTLGAEQLGKLIEALVPFSTATGVITSLRRLFAEKRVNECSALFPDNPSCGMIARYERFTMLWGAFSSNAGLLPYARS